MNVLRKSLVSAVALGALFIRRALTLQRALQHGADPVESMRLFRFSIAYLSLLFVAMAADRLIGGPAIELADRLAFVTGAVMFCAFEAAILVEVLRWRAKAPAPCKVGTLDHVRDG